MPRVQTALLIFVNFLLQFDVVASIITCNRVAGNTNFTSNECTGTVCLIRQEGTTAPLYYDCGEGAMFTHYPDGCYGSPNATLLCVCRTAKCNTASYIASVTFNAAKPEIRCNGSLPTTSSTLGTCVGRFCLSHSARDAPQYYCLNEPPMLMSFAPFLGLCYRFEYGRTNTTGKLAGTICVCDTAYCSDGISSLPTAPETVIGAGNQTTAGVECYTNENRTLTCRGDVCFIYRHTLTKIMERGCLISQRTAEARKLLYPAYTRDAFTDYYVCNTPHCNNNIATANASIYAMPVTTANPIDVTGGTTPDEWWTTPRGWTGGPDWNNTWNETDPDWNGTNITTTTPGRKAAQQFTLPFSFLIVLLTTLLVS